MTITLVDKKQLNLLSFQTDICNFHSNAVVPIKTRLLLLFLHKQHISSQNLPTQPEAHSPSHPHSRIFALTAANTCHSSWSSLGRRRCLIFSFLPMATRSKRRFSFISRTISFRDHISDGSWKRWCSVH